MLSLVRAVALGDVVTRTFESLMMIKRVTVKNA